LGATPRPDSEYTECNIGSSTRLRTLATALRGCNRLGYETCGGDSKWNRAKGTEGDNVTDLDFADDVLIDETAEQLQKLTNSVASCAKENGLDINVRKTKYMKIDPCTGSYVATEG